MRDPSSSFWRWTGAPQAAELARTTCPSGRVVTLQRNHGDSTLWIVDEFDDETGGDSSAAAVEDGVAVALFDDCLVAGGQPPAGTVEVELVVDRRALRIRPNRYGVWLVRFDGTTPPFQLDVVARDHDGTSLRSAVVEWPLEEPAGRRSTRRRPLRRIRYGSTTYPR